jgi:hypothetical protein
MKAPWLYILLGAVTVFLLWQFSRVRGDNMTLRAELAACRDSISQRDTIVDTIWREVTVKEYVTVDVPIPVYVVDSIFITPPLARYEDSVALDSMVTLFYRLNVRGTLLSQGYRYRAVIPEVTKTETIYLPGDCPVVRKWGASIGAGYFDGPAVVGQINVGPWSAGYAYTGRHGAYLLYRLR